MVKRYSHTAIVTIQSGQLVKGEWGAGEPTEIEVTGQYFPSNSGQQLKQNADGREFIVHGELSTKSRPVPDAKHIRIDSIGLDVDIICWEPFQSHSVIYVWKGGLTPMWSDREVERLFDYFVDRAEERIYKVLQRAGEEFVKIARKKGNYQDHTGNLRSSIGYVIVKDGDILTENYELSEKGSERHPGMREAKRLVSELIPLYKRGWVLIGVAAMPYAKYVEAIDNLDVISVATEHTEDWIKKQSRILFSKLAEKGY